MRTIGIDPADDLTRWAVAGGGRVVAEGREPSAVEVDGRRVDRVVGLLGRAEPIVVGSVPYGAEALLGRLLSSILDGARAAHGDLVVAVVHDDDLDEYRRSLIVEAARVGEVGTVELVPRSQARQAAAGHTADADLADAIGAALLLDERHRGGGGIGPAAAIGGGAAIGIAAGAVVSTATGSGGAATAAAPTAGPTGIPLTPTTGPTGVPLTSTIGAPAKKVPIGAVVGAGVAVVAVVIGVIVAVTRSGDEPAVRPVAGVAAAEPAAGPATPGGDDPAPATTAALEPTAPSTPATTTAPSDTTGTTPDSIDVSAFAGGWQGECDPFIDGSGGASGSRYEVTQTGPGTVEFAILAMLYTGGCGTPGVEEGRVTFTLVATGESTLNGVSVVAFDGSAGATDIGVIPPDMLAAQTWFLGIDDQGLRISDDGVSFLPIASVRE